MYENVKKNGYREFDHSGTLTKSYRRKNYKESVVLSLGHSSYLELFFCVLVW